LHEVHDGAELCEVKGGAELNKVHDSAKLYKVDGGAELNEVYGSTEPNKVHDNAELYKVDGGAELNEVYGGAELNKVHDSAELYKVDGGVKLYEKIAGYVDDWGRELIGESGYSSVGAVVGATYPEQARALRKLMKSAYILVPGYGAQGGTADSAAASFNSDGLGAIVNASRSIMCAWKHDRWEGKFGHEEFGLAAREELKRMRDELNLAIGRKK
jgi:orotidine-5'-phosphate decarboxylase